MNVEITEEILLKIFKIQSNLTPKDFQEIGIDNHEHKFQLFARGNWNLLGFMFNQCRDSERKLLIDYLNNN